MRECVMRSAAITVRLEPVVKGALEKAAKRDDRTVAQYVERLILANLRQHGFLSEVDQE
jgi:hypothetical protein